MGSLLVIGLIIFYAGMVFGLIFGAILSANKRTPAAVGEQPTKSRSCGFIPPTPGYAPCTRSACHDGPCAHPLKFDAQPFFERGNGVVTEKQSPQSGR